MNKLHEDAFPDDLERKQEPRNPEINGIAHPILEKIHRWLGSATKQSVMPKTKLAETPVERPLSLRERRARILHAIQENRTAPSLYAPRIQELRNEAHDLDELARQSLNQGTLAIEMGDLGTIAARVTLLEGSKLPGRETKEKNPPVFFIPGISNDIECVDTVGWEIARSGRDVAVVGHPESHMGEVTKEFADACERETGYGPHCSFFLQALQRMFPEGEIELWGFSAGSPIIAEMLARNPELAKRVTKAVLVNPASSVALPAPDRTLAIDPIMVRGVANDGLGLAMNPRRAAYTLTQKRVKTVEPEAEGQRALKGRVFKAVLARVRKPSPEWGNMHVKENGKIVVVTTKNDLMTECGKAFNNENPLPNAQMVPVIELEGKHNTALMYPEIVVEKVNAA